jgi:hypothetical protein
LTSKSRLGVRRYKTSDAIVVFITPRKDTECSEIDSKYEEEETTSLFVVSIILIAFFQDYYWLYMKVKKSFIAVETNMAGEY